MAEPFPAPPNEPSTHATTHVGAASLGRNRPSFFHSRWVLVSVIAVVLASMTVAYAATFGQRQVAEVCGTLTGTRHGVPCDIPLPANSVFTASSSGTAPDGGTYRNWKFTVAQPHAQVHDYFVTQLHVSGWPCLTESESSGAFIMHVGKKPARQDEQLTIVVGGASSASSEFVLQLNEHTPWPAGTSCS